MNLHQCQCQKDKEMKELRVIILVPLSCRWYFRWIYWKDNREKWWHWQSVSIYKSNNNILGLLLSLQNGFCFTLEYLLTFIIEDLYTNFFSLILSFLPSNPWWNVLISSNSLAALSHSSVITMITQTHSMTSIIIICVLAVEPPSSSS